MTRKEQKVFKDDRSAACFTINTVLEIWGTNSTLSEKKVMLEVTSFDLESDWRERWSKEVALSPNSSTEIYKGSLPGQPTRTSESELPKVIIVSARLLNECGAVLARYSNWPEPFKFIKFPPVKDIGLKVTVGSDRGSVTLSAQKPVKGLILDVDGDYAKWNDQAIDLVPDDPQTVEVIGLNGRDVKVRFLGDGSA
jgi:beta-mannosidase